MKGMLAPKYREVLLGHAEVRQTYKVSGVGTIAGCYVKDGKVTARLQGACGARQHRHLRGRDGLAAALQGRRQGGRLGLRVRHDLREVQRHQGGRHRRSLLRHGGDPTDKAGRFSLRGPQKVFCGPLFAPGFQRDCHSPNPVSWGAFLRLGNSAVKAAPRNIIRLPASANSPQARLPVLFEIETSQRGAPGAFLERRSFLWQAIASDASTRRSSASSAISSAAEGPPRAGRHGHHHHVDTTTDLRYCRVSMSACWTKQEKE